MTVHPLKTLLLISSLLTGIAHADKPTEGERRYLESRKEAARLTREASNPDRPLVATDTIIPDVDDLARRYKLTQAKLKPEYLAAYKPGPAHEVLHRLGCEVLGATPLGAPIQGRELHMEALAYRCADGAQGSVTTARNAPPDVHVSLDTESVTGDVSSRPAVVRYFRAQGSGRLVIVQSWMAGPNYLLTLEQALPPAITHTAVRTGSAWAKAREMAQTLDQAYATR